MNEAVYLTALGKFLPGKNISNQEMEDHLGMIGGKPSRLKARILKQNGITGRHYAIDREGKILYWNCDLAAEAARAAFSRAEVKSSDVEYLAAATSQSDVLAPGFASMVHAALKMPPCEIATLHGVCASGMMALKNAYLNVRSGEKKNAVVCASEFTSRFFRPGLFEMTRQYQETGRVPFDAEFLRWMLSDGAGATIVESRPNERGLSLRVEWMDLVSYADSRDVCMFAGANKAEGGSLGRSWYDYQNFADAGRDGAILLKQDLGLVEEVVALGVGRYFALVEEGKFQPAEIDWMVCHYSSHIFRGKIFELLEKGGGMIPAERWFTNLYTKGNTGSASIFIMLEELFNEGHLKPGQKILCMVPESGRFIVSFMLLSVVEGHYSPEVCDSHVKQISSPGNETDEQGPSQNDLSTQLVRQLAQVWVSFESRLNQIPVVDQINRGKLRLDDYRLLLLNLRQQVVEGARWITRAASHITSDSLELRAMFIKHAVEEHRDYRLLEKDYLAVGGRLEEITNGEKNVGSEALSAWMFHRASQENPFDLLGAMFIIEGLGTRLAGKWARKIREQLNLSEEQISFLSYHSEHDDDHFAKLELAFGSGFLTTKMVERIVKTAKVTARLYALQLEELNNF